MYPRSFLWEEEAKIDPQRKNFVKSARKQYGNPDLHAIFCGIFKVFFDDPGKMRLWAEIPLKVREFSFQNIVATLCIDIKDWIEFLPYSVGNLAYNKNSHKSLKSTHRWKKFIQKLQLPLLHYMRLGRYFISP